MRKTCFAAFLIALTLWLSLGLAAFTSSVQAQSYLPYSEGGDANYDPGASLSPDLRRYVDATNGDNSADGRSPATAWKTLSKVRAEVGGFAPGTHILLKRGESWGEELRFINIHGTDGNRIVLGAYGPLQDKNPSIVGGIGIVAENCSYLMIRDLDTLRIGPYRDTHHIIVFNNVVHGADGNGIAINGAAHHIAIVQNLVYDVRRNDAITVHQDFENNNVLSSHWIVDNVTIGNAGMEDMIDIEMGDYLADGQQVQGDVKVINNRMQVKSVPGLSVLTGEGQKALNYGHDGKYFWILGNTMSGGSHIGVNVLSSKEHMQISGNVMFKMNSGNHKNYWVMSTDDAHVEHNTVIHSGLDRAPVMLQAPSNLNFLNNLLIRTQPGNFIEVPTDPPSQFITAMDFNWYGYSDQPTVDGQSWESWRTYSGFDTYSRYGDVPGVSVPSDTYHDPRNWTDPAFLDHFIPDTSWAGNNGADTPGAFDKDGNRLGITIQPFAGLAENGGYGWEGPLLIQERYPLPIQAAQGQGYWKNAPELWPSGAEPSAPFYSSNQTWLEVLATPPKGGNAYYILARQYVAARLNVLNGIGSSSIMSELIRAGELLSAESPQNPPTGAMRADFIETAEALERFNNGE